MSSDQNRDDAGDSTAVGKFSIPYKDLQDLADACKGRKFAEEVELYHRFGGDDWIERGLCTNLQKGLTGDQRDMTERKEAYGDNHEHVRPPKSFMSLLCTELEDFTHRILLVASVLSVIIDMSFAEPQRRSTAWIEGFAIFIAVFVCAGVASMNDYQKERQFQQLNKVAGDRKKVNLVRNGQIQIIHQSFVMVGDIIKLQQGMQVPADGIVIEAADLTTDEAAMTGEPDPIKKNTLSKCMIKQKYIEEEGGRNEAKSHDVPSCVILSGTRILTGDGKMIVITTGSQSVIGKIKAILKQEDQESTPLQQKLEAMARDIGNFGLISASVIVVVLIVRLIIERTSEGVWDHSKHWGELLKFFIIGITVIVVAIPEGLPLAVTLSLAYSVKKMLVDQNLVRKMQACQTMGGADCICSDKTGTLTTNQMTLTHWWNDNLEELPIYNKEIDLLQLVPKEFKDLWVVSMACNGAAMLKPEPKGSRTEIALLQFLQKCGVDYEIEREQYSVSLATIQFPFSSARKRMGMVLPYEGQQRLFEQGGSDKIVAACTHFHDKTTGKVIPIDSQLRERIDVAIKTMADKALRTIGMAYQDITENDDITTKDERSGVYQIETQDLVLVGILGIADILREEVPGAIVKCQLAGIKVRMVTGDNKDTARAIARDCGIISGPDELVMEGDQFIQMTGGVICRWCKLNMDCQCPLDSDALVKQKKECESARDSFKRIVGTELQEYRNLKKASDEKRIADEKGIISFDIRTLSAAEMKKVYFYQLSLRVPDEIKLREDTLQDMEQFQSFYLKLSVMARSQPEHKYALVTGLKELGHVVAVTGDGTNDAPALKKADVGFAMGIAGTEVAREAAAIILLDDNFQSIVSACMWGRNIYDSIQKFIQFQLTVNVVAVCITLVGAAACKQEILKPIQMLWVNLIMDTFASLALATEPPTESLLLRKPQKRDQYIITKKMFKHILGQAAWQLTVLFIFLFAGQSFLPQYQDDYDQQLFEQWNSDRKNFPQPVWWMGQYSDEKLTRVRTGQEKGFDGTSDEYGKIEKLLDVPSRHFTFIFTVFVLLQIFNFVNARKLKDEFNIFEGFSRNPLFIIIVGIIILFQILLTTFGGHAFHCYTYYGLVPQQWGICIMFALGSWVVSFILKLIPEEQCIQTGQKEVDPKKSSSLSLSFKRKQLAANNVNNLNPNPIPYQNIH